MPSIDVFLHDERSITPQAVRALYDTVAWWPERSEAQIARMLGSGLSVGAWEGDQLVGFARAVADAELRAYIEDVVVHPSHRRMGVGKSMLTRLLAALDHIALVTLFCEPELVSFYSAQGFRAFPSRKVMHRRRA